MRKLYFTLFLAFVAPAHADSWSEADKYRAYLFLGVTYADYKQTMYIAEHPLKYKEKNTFLGDHPTTSHVKNHFMINTIGNLLITNALPSSVEGMEVNPRAVWQYLSIATELKYVIENRKIGIHISF